MGSSKQTPTRLPGTPNSGADATSVLARHEQDRRQLDGNPLFSSELTRVGRLIETSWGIGTRCLPTCRVLRADCHRRD